MTHPEAVTQFARLLATCVPPAEPEAVFSEWFPALVGVAVDDVADGITRLLRDKTDRWFPTLGEIRGAIASVQAGREPVSRCRTCDGSHWVASRPYRANGAHVYEGVSRCPDCGVPAPRLEGVSRQTPLSDREYAVWRAGRPQTPVLHTRDEFLAAVAQVAGPKVRARLALVTREPGMEG